MVTELKLRPQSALPAAGWFGHERFHICKI
jgi:hypothetical protein